MADEAIISTAEEIAGKEEGTVASLDLESNEAPDVVPLRDLMALKDKNVKLTARDKESNARIKELENALNSRNADSSDDDDTLSRFSDVDPDFIRGITTKAKKEALAEMRAEFAQRDQKEEFGKKLDNTVDQQLEVARTNGVNLPSKVDKNLIKQLALANPTEKVSVLLERFYWINEKGKATTENDMRPATDFITESVDIDRITNDQRAKIFADPKARKAYFDKKYS